MCTVCIMFAVYAVCAQCVKCVYGVSSKGTVFAVCEWCTGRVGKTRNCWIHRILKVLFKFTIFFSVTLSRVFSSSPLSFITTSTVINELLLLQIVYKSRAKPVVINESTMIS